MTDHNTDPEALARQRQSQSQTPDPAAPFAQGTAQANPAHRNPRPDHPGPVNPVTPGYSGSRGSEDDLEADTLGPQPGATPRHDPADDAFGRHPGAIRPQDRPLDQNPPHHDSNQRGVPGYAPPAGEAGYRRDVPQRDADLKQQVYDRLNAHPLINPTEIDVQVDQGCVTLSGTVTDPETIRNAAVCLSPIAGIVSLYNELKTSPHDRKSDSEQETSNPVQTRF